MTLALRLAKSGPPGVRECSVALLHADPEAELVLKVARAEHASPAGNEEPGLTAPIRLQGEVIGFLHASEKLNNVPFTSTPNPLPLFVPAVSETFKK